MLNRKPRPICVNGVLNKFAKSAPLKYNAHQRLLSMIRIILNILLIGAIVTCPLRCLTGLCNSGDGCCSTAKSCCQHCRSQEHCAVEKHGASQENRADGNLGHPSSMPFEPIRSGGCPCICNGALSGAMGSLLAAQIENVRLRHLGPLGPAAALTVAAEMAAHPPDLLAREAGHSRCILHRVLLL